MIIILFLAERPIKRVLFSLKIMCIRPLGIFLWDFENLQFFKNFYCRNTAKTQIDRFEFLLYFCSKKFWGKFQNFQFSKFHRKASKDRMNIIFEENKTPILRLSAKTKIVVIRPIINFWKDPSTPPPLYDA